MVEHRCNKVLNYASHDFITNFTYCKHLYFFHRIVERQVWRYQRVSQKWQIEEGQTIQWPIEKEQKDRQWFAKNYTENWRSSNTTPTFYYNWGWTQVLRKGKQLQFHMWRLSCYSGYKPGEKSWIGRFRDMIL
jgi:hypothetical protein